VSGFDGRTRDFYVRQLRDWKGSADVDAMTPKGMRAYGEICGWTLARAHARTGDPVSLAGYLGSGSSFDTAVREFASVYADQNERDHAALVEAIADGEVQAQEGV
jgi:predicted alpha/beta hydrolase